MHFNPKSKNKNLGFTLIELLVVIAIISLLSSIVFASLSTVRKKARDARRITDLNQIKSALEMYINQYSVPPTTGSYGENNTGGWDASYEGDFMQFLKETAGTANPQNIKFMEVIPIDPINNGTVGTNCNTSLNSGSNVYCYYYYPAPNAMWGFSSPHYRIGTRFEATSQIYWVVGVI